MNYIAKELNIGDYSAEEKYRLHYNMPNVGNYIKQARFKSPNNFKFHCEKTIHDLKNLRITLKYCD